MQAVITFGLDIAKSVFQVHGIGTEGKVGYPPATQVGPLQEVVAVPCRHRGLRLIAPLSTRASGTRPYREADATCLCEAVRQAPEERSADAEAICEAVQRSNMRFVPIKTSD